MSNTEKETPRTVTLNGVEIPVNLISAANKSFISAGLLTEAGRRFLNQIEPLDYDNFTTQVFEWEILARKQTTQETIYSRRPESAKPIVTNLIALASIVAYERYLYAQNVTAESYAVSDDFKTKLPEDPTV